MAFLLIHKPLGPLPPDMLKGALGFTKQHIAAPSRVVPGGAS